MCNFFWIFDVATWNPPQFFLAIALMYVVLTLCRLQVSLSLSFLCIEDSETKNTRKHHESIQEEEKLIILLQGGYRKVSHL